jgi:hypothetical protein
MATHTLKNLHIPDFHLHANIDSWFNYSYKLITSTLSVKKITKKDPLWCPRDNGPQTLLRSIIFFTTSNAHKNTPYTPPTSLN